MFLFRMMSTWQRARAERSMIELAPFSICVRSNGFFGEPLKHAACHTAHTPHHNTRYNIPQHTTTRRPQHLTKTEAERDRDRQRQTETERDRERRRRHKEERREEREERSEKLCLVHPVNDRVFSLVNRVKYDVL